MHVGTPLALGGTRGGRRFRLTASAVVDASGPRGFLSRLLDIPETEFDHYPRTQALYSHFTGVRRFDGVRGPSAAEAPPYAPDDAALHHVFDGGWMWVLRFNNGVTSAGVAVTDRLAADLVLADGEPAWRRLLARYPSIAEQFGEAQPIREFTAMPRVAWRAGRAAGQRWAMLPSAAAFVDPFFSTGIPMTLLGVERIARALESGEFGRDEWAGEYEATTLREADHTARFIAGCYASFPHFESFTAYAMFYFAAASFSEMARRLGQPSRGFLFADDPAFTSAMARCAAAAGEGTLTLAQVARAIEPLNIAGLCDASKRNWYDVDLEEAVRGSDKLGVARETVRATLRQMINAQD